MNQRGKDYVIQTVRIERLEWLYHHQIKQTSLQRVCKRKEGLSIIPPKEIKIINVYVPNHSAYNT